MTNFTQFIENTKDTCMYITSGLLVIAVTALSKEFLGTITSKAIQIGGIILLAMSLFSFSKELKTFLMDKPDLFTNPEYSVFTKNTIMSCGVCIILFITVLYATYSLIF